MLTNCSVLVTGGAGFIGANLVRLLVDEGARVRILDDLSVGSLAYLEGLPVDVIEGSILDPNLLARVVPSCDAVVHLAAQTGVPGSIADPRRDCEMNVIGTLNVLEACRLSARPSPPRVVFASSNAPLGRQTPPATEDKAPLPISPYGASKLAGEAYCLAYHGSWNIPTVILRFANLYGPYSTHKGSVVAKFFKDILDGGGITVHGEGSQTRDFIYVGDLCSAVLRALSTEVAGEIFQIATGVETSIAELTRIIRQICAPGLRVHHAPARQGDVQKNYSAVRKAEAILGWRADTDLEAGLQKTWAWFERVYAPKGAMLANSEMQES